MMNKFKKIFAILLFSIGLIYPQVNKVILSEFDMMAEIIAKDIRTAIYNGEIPANIAITSFASYGFTEAEKKYFQEVINKTFYSDVSFKLLTVSESQAIQVEEKGEKLIIKKGASKNTDLKKYAASINSKHYGEIYIYLTGRSIYMKVLIHDADTGDVVWSKSRSVKRDNRFTAELGYFFGYSFSITDFYHYLHTFFGARAVGLGEFGVSIDLGGYHKKALSDFKNEFDRVVPKNLNDLGVSLLLAPKVSFNIIELGKFSYNGFDIYAIFKPGLRMDMLVNANDTSRTFKPRFYFAGIVGLGFGFSRINLDVNFDVNPYNGLMLSLGVYYKF